LARTARWVREAHFAIMIPDKGCKPEAQICPYLAAQSPDLQGKLS
jgi:hypothetical protein